VNEHPIKVLLIITEKNKYALINIHHIAFDGWSTDILLKELESFYLHYTKGVSLDLPELDIQYKDFAIWQKNCLKGDRLDKLLSYWKDKVAGYETLEFPTDKPRQSKVDYEGDNLSFEFTEQLSDQLRNIAKNKGTSLYSLLLSCFNILLYKYTGQEIITVGTPAANRNNTQVKNLIGFFINSLVLKTELDPEASFTVLIDQVQKNVIEAQQYQDMPFEQIVDALGIEHDPSRHPIFQIMFGVQSFGRSSKNIFNPLPLEDYYKPAKFDISFFIDDGDKALKGSINYSTSLFNKETIERVKDHYCQVIRQIVNNTELKIREIDIISKSEYNKTIYEWNNTDAIYPNDKTIHQMFEEQVEKTPDNIAVVFEDNKITYRELNERANQLAHTVREDYKEYFGKAIKGDTLIGLYLERSIFMIVGVLGILKSGAAYVPFDMADPEERLRFKINDCGCKMVITTSACIRDLTFLADSDTVPIALDAYWDEIAKAPVTNPEMINKSSDMAYIIYTSGSTGKPKGVMTEHYGAVNFISYHIDRFKTSGNFCNVIQSISINFDASWTELALSLFKGSAMYLLKSISDMSVSDLTEFIVKNNINILVTTPAVVSNIPQKKIECLEYMIAGGEVCEKSVMDYWSRNLKYFNAYGPTEATVCTTYSLHDENKPNRDIGRPLQNKTAYILDKDMKPVPIGVHGELFIGGVGLARGYYNRPDITTERFIDNPFVSEEDKRKKRNLKFYKTGDLCRWLPDGDIEYIGRNDNQVKIRGFRVELGEIENVLSEHPSISQCTVLCKSRGEGNKYLAAYYTEDKIADSHKFADFLLEKLPNYMVPAIFIRLEKMPLTTNGKIDRKALPDPEFKTDKSEYVSPRNDIEIKLCEAWQKVLGIDKIGIRDDFFQIGGNSILAMKLSHLMSEILNVEIPVSVVFSKKRIIDIAESVNDFKDSVKIEKCTDDKPQLSFAQERLYFLDEFEGGLSAYNIPICFSLSEATDIEILKRSIDSVIMRHDVLRTAIQEDTHGNLHQLILENPPKINEYSLSEEKFKEQISADINTVFDLKHKHPVKVSFYKVSDIVYLLINVHHIAFDGWSMDVLLKDLNKYYNFYKSGNEEQPFLELDIQYKDFAAWQREYLSGERLDAELSYWKKELEGLETLEFPTDRQRPVEVSYAGDDFMFNIDRELSDKLREIASDNRTTLYTVLLSAFYLLLHKYTGQDEIVIGTPTANRDYTQLENLIGFFVNSTVLRCRINPECRVVDLIKETA
ncbi:amino acid adenylation domain-containing protein, partial [bacterium]|nr:amino acid adenylation domain-containing protein [bacterium]